MPRRRAIGLAAALIAFIASRLVIVSLPPVSSDVVKYHRKAIQVAAGAVPYRDVAIEYPPLSWWMIAAAYSEDADPAAAGAAPAFFAYRESFHVLSFAAELIAFALLLVVGYMNRPDRLVWLAFAYVGCSSFQAHVIYDRLDTGLLFFFMAWLTASSLAMRLPTRAGLWSHAAYALLGLGAAVKVVPLLCLPLLLIAEHRATTGVRAVLSRLGAFALAGALPFVPHLLQAGAPTMEFLRYHEARGLQIESVAASVVLLLSFFGLEVGAERAFQSWALAGPLANALAWVSSLLLGAFLIAITFAATRCRAETARAHAVHLACLAVLGAAVLSKVLSPQYFVWLLPLTLLLSVSVARRRDLPWITLALVIVMISTVWLFPYNYFSHIPPSAFSSGAAAMHNPHGLIPELNTLSKAVLILRNACFTGLVVLLGLRTLAAADAHRSSTATAALTSSPVEAAAPGLPAAPR